MNCEDWIDAELYARTFAEQFLKKHRKLFEGINIDLPDCLFDKVNTNYIHIDPQDTHFAKLFLEACNITTLNPIARMAIQRLKVHAQDLVDKKRLKMVLSLNNPSNKEAKHATHN